MPEIHSLEEFDSYIEAHGSLAGAVIQGVDLRDRRETVLSSACNGTVFLGVTLDVAALRHVNDAGAIVFPDLPDLPFDPYRPALYTQDDLTPALDEEIYEWAQLHPRGSHLPVMHALARRLHDHAIDDALRDHLDHYPNVVAVMGGHGLTRSDPTYREVVGLGHGLAQRGWHVATGGGPGAMEAANLGAWLSPQPEPALELALATLAEATDFHDFDPYHEAAEAVRRHYPDGELSLAVPTWFYGHEPTNLFASHIAKYFANSIREDGLLAIAQRGVVFAPGSAGTTQEVFQDATQNHYEVFGVISPMVFLGREFWQNELPALPLLRNLAGKQRYADLIGVVDSAAEAVAFLDEHPPLTS